MGTPVEVRLFLFVRLLAKPIKFTGTGEKITDIETFHPDRMSSRILGMGDLLTLIEKASQEYDEKKSLELAERCVKTPSTSMTSSTN